MKPRFQAVLVGMGPAGMAAAFDLGRARVRTALIDQASSPGGQVYRKPPDEFHVPHYESLIVGEGAQERVIPFPG